MKPVKIKLPNSNNKAFIPLKSNIEVLVGVAFLPPSLIPALRNIGVLHHKKAELRILLQHSVSILDLVSKKKSYEWKFCITKCYDLIKVKILL